MLGCVLSARRTSSRTSSKRARLLHGSRFWRGSRAGRPSVGTRIAPRLLQDGLRIFVSDIPLRQ